MSDDNESDRKRPRISASIPIRLPMIPSFELHWTVICIVLLFSFMISSFVIAMKHRRNIVMKMDGEHMMETAPNANIVLSSDKEDNAGSHTSRYSKNAILVSPGDSLSRINGNFAFKQFVDIKSEARSESGRVMERMWKQFQSNNSSSTSVEEGEGGGTSNASLSAMNIPKNLIYHAIPPGENGNIWIDFAMVNNQISNTIRYEDLENIQSRFNATEGMLIPDYGVSRDDREKVHRLSNDSEFNITSTRSAPTGITDVANDEDPNFLWMKSLVICGNNESGYHIKRGPLIEDLDEIESSSATKNNINVTIGTDVDEVVAEADNDILNDVNEQRSYHMQRILNIQLDAASRILPKSTIDLIREKYSPAPISPRKTTMKK